MGKLLNSITNLGFNQDRSLIAFILYAATFAGILGLSLLGIPIGDIYFKLAVGTLGVFFFMLLFIKFTNKEYGLKFPVADSNFKGALYFLIGLAIPLLIKLVSKGRFLTWKIMAPLQLFNLGPQAVGSYETLIAQANPFFKVFSVVITAGVVEEITLGFGAFSIGLVMGVFFLKYVMGTDLKSKKGFIGINIIASLVSMFAFALAHNLNPQYTTLGMFIAAALFRVIMNIAMFYGLGMEFTIGYHMGNNAAFLGGAALFAAIIDPIGIVVVIMLLSFAVLAGKYLIQKVKSRS